MNEKILERLKNEFAFIGDEKISGHTAMKIINDVIEELTIPKEVEQAQNYIAECNRDMGFMGSPEYDRQKKIVDAYFEPIRQREKDEEEKANKQIVDSFKKKTEGKLIPVVKMPQTISEVFGLSKGENPVKAKLNKFSDERRVKAIQDLLDYCNIPRRSVDVQDMCKKVTLGVPTLQWLKVTGWLKKNDLKHWQTTDLNGWFTLGHLESLKKDIKNNKNLAIEKDLNPNNFETETLAFIKGIDPEKWYSMSSLFVYMSRAKIPVHVREAIVDQRFENNKGKFKLNESKAILPVNATNELVALQTEIHDKIFIKYLGTGTESSWRLHIKTNLQKENGDKIFNWLVNNGYFEYTKKLLPIGLRVVKTAISLEEVSRMNKDIKTGNSNSLRLDSIDFRFTPDEFPTTTKEKHEEVAKGNKSIVENLKQQRIEFAKMLFKLGDVKAANEILTKELE